MQICVLSRYAIAHCQLSEVQLYVSCNVKCRFGGADGRSREWPRVVGGDVLESGATGANLVKG